MNKVAIYARVSTKSQEERQTIEQQLIACREYCARKNWEVAEEFKDEAVSGSTPFDSRPAAKRLLEALDAKQVDAVVIYCVDRLSRSNEFGIPAYNLLLRKTKDNVDFVIQSFDATPEGKLQFHTFIGIAEYERGNFRRRSMSGIRTRIEAGKMYRASTPRYGYRYNSEIKQMEVKEDTAEVVRRIYAMYLEGLGAHAIAARLSDNGVPVPSAGTKRGVKAAENAYGWHKTTVRNILQSPVYVGRGSYRARMFEDGKEITKVLPMGCPPIIDDQLFTKVQELVRKHSADKKRNTRLLYLLQGLLYCGHCDSRYSSLSDGKGTKYYRCARRNLYGKRRGGHEGVKWAYRAEVLDDVARKFVRAFMERPQLLLPHVQRQVETLVTKAEGLSGETTALKRRLQELEADENRVLDMGAKGMYKNDAQMFTKLDTIRKDQAKVEGQLKSLTRRTTPVEKARRALLRLHEQLTEMLVAIQVNDPDGEVRLEWAGYPDKELKAVIRYLVDRIVVEDNGKLTFKGVLMWPGAEESGNLPLPSTYKNTPHP